MVASLDGRATLGGTSRALGGPQDLQMLLALRRRADALIVGPGTVRAEGYGPLPCPAVLVSRSFDLPWEAGLFAAPGQRVLVYTRAEREPPAVAADGRDRGRRGARARCSPTCGRAASSGCCARAGRRSTARCWTTGLLDELFLTLVAGRERRGRPVDHRARASAAALELRAVATADGDLYLRYSV